MREETLERGAPVGYLLGGAVVLGMLALFLWPGLPGGSPVGRDVPTAETHLGWASYLVRLQEDTLAEEELRKALVLDSGSQEAHLHLGNLLMKRGLYDEAGEEYLAALSAGPNATAHYNLGLLERKRGRPDEAVAHFESALRLTPDSWSGYVQLGIALEEAGRTEEAVEAFRRAAEGNRRSIATVVRIGRDHRLAGRPERCLELLEGMAQVYPAEPAILYELGMAHLDAGRSERARELLREVVRLAPSYASAQEHLDGLGGDGTPEGRGGEAKR